MVYFLRSDAKSDDRTGMSGLLIISLSYRCGITYFCPISRVQGDECPFLNRAQEELTAEYGELRKGALEATSLTTAVCCVGAGRRFVQNVRARMAPIVDVKKRCSGSPKKATWMGVQAHEAKVQYR